MPPRQEPENVQFLYGNEARSFHKQSFHGRRHDRSTNPQWQRPSNFITPVLRSSVTNARDAPIWRLAGQRKPVGYRLLDEIATAHHGTVGLLRCAISIRRM